jgi:hypothetical protein
LFVNDFILADGEAKHFYKRLGFRGFTDVMAMFEPTANI